MTGKLFISYRRDDSAGHAAGGRAGNDRDGRPGATASRRVARRMEGDFDSRTIGPSLEDVFIHFVEGRAK